ncbi:MAG: hypothetical protein HOI95_14810 [Chromatiales bacterium]|nr:hypothetical protein [Chromatiales bacterium]
MQTLGSRSNEIPSPVNLFKTCHLKVMDDFISLHRSSRQHKT